MDQDWQSLSEQILTDIKEWRRAHPKATFREIEDEVHERMSRLEAQVLQDTAQESLSREWSGASEQERPKCPICSTPRPRTRETVAELASSGRARGNALPKLWHLPCVWGRSFSPSMRN
jgi:hypothetical protein